MKGWKWTFFTHATKDADFCMTSCQYQTMLHASTELEDHWCWDSDLVDIGVEADTEVTVICDRSKDISLEITIKGMLVLLPSVEQTPCCMHKVLGTSFCQ